MNKILRRNTTHQLMLTPALGLYVVLNRTTLKDAVYFDRAEAEAAYKAGSV